MAAAVPASYERKVSTLVDDVYGDHEYMVRQPYALLAGQIGCNWTINGMYMGYPAGMHISVCIPAQVFQTCQNTCKLASHRRRRVRQLSQCNGNLPVSISVLGLS